MSKRNKTKIFDNDRWLTRNFERIIDTYAGGYILIGAGKVLYTNKDGTPRQLIEKAKTEYPNITPLFFRVPYPHEFICALIAR